MSAHLLAGEAFVAAFKREPTSPADSAWMNGYEAACSSAGARTEPAYVYECSNPACGAIWRINPNGHCPKCKQSNGGGWSCVTRVVLPESSGEPSVTQCLGYRIEVKDGIGTSSFNLSTLECKPADMDRNGKEGPTPEQVVTALAARCDWLVKELYKAKSPGEPGTKHPFSEMETDLMAQSTARLQYIHRLESILSQCRTTLKRSEGGFRGVCDVTPNETAYSIIADCVAAVAAIDGLSPSTKSAKP